MAEFIADNDKANARVHALEDRLGLPPSDWIECIDETNARIEELERTVPQLGSASQPSPISAPLNAPTSAPLRVTGIERAIAANRGVPTFHEEAPALTGLQRAIAANTRKHQR